MIRLLPALALPLALAAAPSSAQMLPPAGAQPLSQIIASVEARDGVVVVLEADWDDDGHWDIEYVDTGNRVHELRLDPVTGAEVPRRRR